METFLQLLTVMVLASILALCVVLLCYYVPSLRRRAMSYDAGQCAVCGVGFYGEASALYGCPACPGQFCSLHCLSRHRTRTTCGGPEAA
jgi:hypothetical protein